MCEIPGWVLIMYLNLLLHTDMHPLALATYPWQGHSGLETTPAEWGVFPQFVIELKQS